MSNIKSLEQYLSEENGVPVCLRTQHPYSDSVKVEGKSGEDLDIRYRVYDSQLNSDSDEPLLKIYVDGLITDSSIFRVNEYLRGSVKDAIQEKLSKYNIEELEFL